MSLRLAGQAVFWLLVAAVVGLFAQWPRFAPLPAGHGELKLSLAHLTARMQPCHQLSAEERQALPPNMRAMERCERARAPAVLELKLDGEVLLAQAVRPAGLHSDGRAYLYRHWALPAGRYTLELALRDSPRVDGFDREQQFELVITPGLSALLTVGDGEAVLHAGSEDAIHSRPRPEPLSLRERGWGEGPGGACRASLATVEGDTCVARLVRLRQVSICAGFPTLTPTPLPGGEGLDAANRYASKDSST